MDQKRKDVQAGMVLHSHAIKFVYMEQMVIMNNKIFGRTG
jgi:hypothetical protein